MIKKQLDSQDSSEILSIQFSGELNMGYKRKRGERGIKDDCMVLF